MDIALFLAAALIVSAVVVIFSIVSVRQAAADARRRKEDARALNEAFSGALEAAQALESVIERAASSLDTPVKSVASGGTRLFAPTYREHFGEDIDRSLQHASKAGVLTPHVQNVLAEWMAATPAAPLPAYWVRSTPHARGKNWGEDLQAIFEQEQANELFDLFISHRAAEGHGTRVSFATWESEALEVLLQRRRAIS